MSTRFTNKNTPMVDSYSLSLVLTAAQVHEKTSVYLSESLNKQGFTFITPSRLNFLSTLECGINYGSEIARNLGVSRQMVAKTVKELCQAGYLEQQAGHGKQKEIVFTKEGELLMSSARKLLADIDVVLSQAIGKQRLIELTAHLEDVNTIVSTLN